MNRRIGYLIFGLLASFFLHAQEPDSTLQENKMNWITDFGAYFVANSEYSSLNGEPLPALSLEGGITYKSFQFGGFGVGFTGEYEQIIIFPTTHFLDFRYGGLVIGYQLIEKGWFQGFVSIRNGYGDVVWANPDNDEYIFRDKMVIIHPEFELCLAPISIIGISFRTGYRWSSTLDIPNLSKLSGFTFSLGIKFDYRYANQ